MSKNRCGYEAKDLQRAWVAVMETGYNARIRIENGAIYIEPTITPAGTRGVGESERVSEQG